MDDIKIFSGQDFLDLFRQSQRNRKPGDSSAGWNRPGFADCNEAVAVACHRAGCRRDNFYHMAHPGEVIFKARDMAYHPTRIGEIVW